MMPASSRVDHRQADERLLKSLAVGALVAGGVIVLARSPRLRRLAWMGASFAITSWLPAWGLRQVREAWSESRPAAPVPALAPAMDDDA